ncbi:MAG: hypothetical protein IMY72_00655 [Bacteroidetes bacterium]|nr:hypothetical protein [Bacteroidota bacterium]
MTKSEIKVIWQICFKLRQQILSSEIQFIGSNEFPSGCCGNVSQDWLLPSLTEAGFKNIQYIYDKENSKGKSHSCLEYQGYIIDITADQKEFKEENNPPIMIIKKEESEFHKQFK